MDLEAFKRWVGPSSRSNDLQRGKQRWEEIGDVIVCNLGHSNYGLDDGSLPLTSLVALTCVLDNMGTMNFITKGVASRDNLVSFPQPQKVTWTIKNEEAGKRVIDARN